MIRITPQNVNNMSGLQFQMQYVRLLHESSDSHNGHKTPVFIGFY